MEEIRDEEVQKETAEEAASQEQAEQETDRAAAPEEDVKAAEEQGTADAEEDDREDAASAGEEPKKKGFFGKKKKDKKDVQIEELTDRVQRQMAEFDNFRKRTEKEKAAMFEVGAKSVIEKLLPTVDSFERGFASVPDEKKEDPFVQGMEKVYRQMMSAFEEIGVKPIEAVGQEFNPQFHNAVMHVEDEEVGENVIVEEFQKGYLYRDSVVRHSMVKVAN